MGRRKKSGSSFQASDLSLTRANMLDPMLVAFPPLREPWNAIVADWGPDEPPVYFAMSELARLLFAASKAADKAPLRAALSVLEHWLALGDHYVREAATVGLIEDLQHELLRSATDAAEILPFLGPRATQAWADVEAFWRGGPIIPDRG